MNKPDLHVVSFSGGKDSTAMLIRMIELNLHIDKVIFCDTYKEFPEMYEHVERVKKMVQGVGVEFVELKNPNTFDYYMFEHEFDRKNKKTFFEGNDISNEKGYSWARSRYRWCTARLKHDVIKKYLDELHQKYNVIQYIGLAYDEQYRLERDSNKKEGLRYPLNEWKWTEKDALQYCYDKGYHWGGLYQIFKRVSCWCCPLQPLSELRKLRKNFPELWEELIEMDNRTYNKFRNDYSVIELEKRFEFEELRISEGKSIKSKEFYNELKNILKS